MFEAGRMYSFVTYDHDGDAQWSGKVIDVQLPLIKVERMGTETILNAHCPSFKSAALWSLADEQEAANAEAEWGDLLATPPAPDA